MTPHPPWLRAGLVLPCAGTGTRVGADRPKQLLDLGGLPVFLWSLRTALAMGRFERVVLVIPPKDESAYRAYEAPDLCEAERQGRLRFVDGGPQRWISVRNGALALGEVDLVAVHDIARPFVTPSHFDAVLAAAAADGAATLACRAVDTVKLGRPADPDTAEAGEYVERTLDRDTIWLVQTPQAFRRSVLEEGWAWIHAHPQVSMTDECGLAESVGRRVRLVPGEPRLDKITTAEDLEFARWAVTHGRIL